MQGLLMAHTVSLCPLKHAAVAKGHGSVQCALQVMPLTAAGMKLSLPQTLARTRARGQCIPVCQLPGVLRKSLTAAHRNRQTQAGAEGEKRGVKEQAHKQGLKGGRRGKAKAAAVEAPPAPAGTVQAPADRRATQKPTVVITGASSGLGLNAAKALADSGDWHVIMACRDYSKALSKARELKFTEGSYTVMHLDLAALDSVRHFVDAFRASGRRLDALVCNAAVYLPTAKEPRYTADGFELSTGTNHLGHFLLMNLLLPDLEKAPEGSPKRVVIVGSITGNTNTLAGNVPPKADLGDLSGLAQKQVMIDGGEFNGAKAYKDSKVCNMLTMREAHRRFADRGVTFASLYPGCIAETGLFREHYPIFRTLFPPFQKYITKGYVSEQEAGKRLAQVVSDASLSKSGVYWSWDNERGSFENRVSEEVGDAEKGRKLWEISEQLVGLA